MTPLAVLEHRLAAWEKEKKTNRYNLAHLADRAIALIRDDISRVGAGSSHGGQE